ncbi:MAG: hypothetical protein Q4B09_09005, partial [Lachnospiraceae bacterium]|nr:hypothetical protein [Lachnospiraceae bacterium]
VSPSPSGRRRASLDPRDLAGQTRAPSPQDDADNEEAAADQETAETPEPTKRPSAEGLPPYEVLRYLLTSMNDSVAMQVPADWGTSATEGELTSYSPANASGAINSSSGTLQTSYCVMPADDVSMSFSEFEANIEKMSIITDVKSEETTAAGCKAQRITYTMNLGANVFYCETVCLAYEDNLYWVQIMQGNKSELDYFPVFDKVVASLDTDEEAVQAADGTVVGQEEVGEATDEPEVTDEP